MKKYRWNKKKFINNLLKLVVTVGIILFIGWLGTTEVEFLTR